MSIQIDRLAGLTEGVATKAPCRVATTEEIGLLGLQTIDGVALTSGDRVLVKDQSNPIDNGVWIASSGAWTRGLDFNAQRDAVDGTTIFIKSGSVNGLNMFRAVGADPIIVGASGLTFSKFLGSSAGVDIGTAPDQIPNNANVIATAKDGVSSAAEDAQPDTIFNIMRRSENIPALDFIPIAQRPDILARTSLYDAADDVYAWLSACVDEKRPGRGTEGTFSLSSVLKNLDNDLSVDCAPGFVLAGNSETADPILDFKDPTGEDRFSLRWRGGVFDNSLGVYVASDQSNTCLNLTRLHNSTIEGARFVGGENIDTTSGNSDSGITAVSCKRLNIVGCVFEGQADACIYTGGANDAESEDDDGGEHIIAHNHFMRSWQAVTIKRHGPRTILIGNTVANCRSGFLALVPPSSGSGEANIPQTGRQILIQSNIFRHIWTRAVEISQYGYSKISGNLIEDWGYDDTGAKSSICDAIRLLGANHVEVGGNSIHLADYTKSADHRGIYIANATIDSTTYTAANNHVHDNDIDNVTVGIAEGAGVGVNSYRDNQFGSDVTTKNSLLNANAVGSVSRLRANVSLNFGTTAAGSRTTQTVSLPGITTKHTASINPPSGAYMVNGCDYQVRCKVDQIDILFVNGSSNDVTLAAANFQINAELFE